MDFKSYGNTDGGTAYVMKIPVSKVLTNVPNPVVTPEWTREFPGRDTVKAIRELDTVSSDANDVVAVLWSSPYTRTFETSLVRLTRDDGESVWESGINGTIDYPRSKFSEAADMRIVSRSLRKDMDDNP